MNRTIPFIDLKAQYLGIKDEIQTAISNLLESTQFVLGDEVSAFETEFAAYCNARYAVAVNSGTSAIHLALLSAGIGKGDEVITVPFTFAATVAAILYTGAVPVFVDINPDTFTMDISQIEKKITKRTKAILPVHLYGQPAEMDPILGIAKSYNLLVIEDAAQAHGAEYNKKRVGSIGNIGCFSFYPSKNLGAFGEGGIIVTNNSGYAETARLLRDWGQDKKNHYILKGYNYRMEGIQGAILRVKLRHLEKWNNTRKIHADYYNKLLSNTNIITPVAMPYSRHVYHIYAIRTQRRDNLHDLLYSKGIHANIHYPMPIYLQPAYNDLGYSAGDFPNSEKASREVLSLPMYPELTKTHIETVCNSIKEWTYAKA